MRPNLHKKRIKKLNKEWIQAHSVERRGISILVDMMRAYSRLSSQGYAPNRVIMHPNMYRQILESGVLNETDQDPREISPERFDLTQEDWRAIGSG